MENKPINHFDIANHYDVIIIGAGPAGLECAKVLSESNKNTLLLEKGSVIGKKVCAGGLTKKAFDFLNLPADFGGRKFKETVFKTKFGKTILKSEEYQVHIINREELGNWQRKKIENTKVKIITDANVKKIEENCVELDNNQKISFSYLVGADGSNSVVRKFLKLETKKIFIAFQYLIKKNFLEVLIERGTDCWYKWIFPQGNYTSIGSGGSPKTTNLRKIRKDFNAWIAKNKIDISQAEFRAFPINCDFRGYIFGNIFLVGDAAGFASPLSGEGIYQALVSGNEVGKLILDSSFKPKRIQEVLKKRRNHLFMMWFIIILGPFRFIFFEFFAFLSKNKYVAKWLIKFFA